VRRRDCSAATADFGNSGNIYSGSWLRAMHKESSVEAIRGLRKSRYEKNALGTARRPTIAAPFSNMERAQTALSEARSHGWARYRCGGAAAVVAATRCVWIMFAGPRKSEAAKKNRTLAAKTIATISSERFSFHAGRSAT
jgi:hypothetical protein